MQIPPELADFSFILAWEEFKSHRAAMPYPGAIPNEKELLDYFAAIGVDNSIRKIKDQMDWEKSILQKQAKESIPTSTS
jgi:hypothetical protein